MEDSTNQYCKLIILIFMQDDNELEKIIKTWIENGLCEKEIRKDEILFKNKKVRPFYIDNIYLFEKKHIAYTFFKNVLLMKPQFYVIGSTFYLFNNENFGVKTCYLKSSEILDFIRDEIYGKKDKIFSKQMYPFGQNILSGTNISITKIPIYFRLKLLMLFHKSFIKSMFQSLKLIKKYPKMIKKHNTNKPISRTTYSKILVQFYSEYKEKLTTILNECENGGLDLGIYETEKRIIKIILKSFINNINTTINKF